MWLAHHFIVSTKILPLGHHCNTLHPKTTKNPPAVESVRFIVHCSRGEHMPWGAARSQYWEGASERPSRVGACFYLDPSWSQSGLVWGWCSVELFIFHRRVPESSCECWAKTWMVVIAVLFSIMESPAHRRWWKRGWETMKKYLLNKWMKFVLGTFLLHVQGASILESVPGGPRLALIWASPVHCTSPYSSHLSPAKRVCCQASHPAVNSLRAGVSFPLGPQCKHRAGASWVTDWPVKSPGWLHLNWRRELHTLAVCVLTLDGK